jgi:hypothetical protein
VYRRFQIAGSKHASLVLVVVVSVMVSPIVVAMVIVVVVVVPRIAFPTAVVRRRPDHAPGHHRDPQNEKYQPSSHVSDLLAPKGARCVPD